ncbi:hypothetical protein LTR94_037171, partial [Friedmanniomyces endolithicus]
FDFVVVLRLQFQGMELQPRLASASPVVHQQRVEQRRSRAGARAADGPAVRRRRRGTGRAPAYVGKGRL